jgi:hypothetical protein
MHFLRDKQSVPKRGADVRYALACRDIPYIQLLSGICTGSAHWFKHFQVQFPKSVESAARHDKLKRIGHPLRVSVLTDVCHSDTAEVTEND